MQKKYSRLSRIEEKKNRRTAIIFGGLTIFLLVFLVFFGVPMIARFGAFIAELQSSQEPIDLVDTTPPAPPRITQPVAFTKKDSLRVEGTAEAGATVQIFLNEEQKETLAGDDGSFSATLFLDDGENTLYARAVDKGGNESGDSKRYRIVSDDEPPKLEVVEPVNGSSFSESQITVKGNSEADVTISINERFAVVDSGGAFSLSVGLNEGSNLITVEATDQAGNSTKQELTVEHNP